MNDLVQLTKENDIAVITINNPPVNALSPGVPEGISEALDRIAQDGSVKAVVLIGGGRTFRGRRGHQGIRENDVGQAARSGVRFRCS